LIPKDGPVILVGNHPNMFIDALIIMVTCDRPVRFITAAKSYRKFFVGWFAKNMGAIPVERPKDLS